MFKGLHPKHWTNKHTHMQDRGAACHLTELSEKDMWSGLNLFKNKVSSLSNFTFHCQWSWLTHHSRSVRAGSVKLSGVSSHGTTVLIPWPTSDSGVTHDHVIAPHLMTSLHSCIEKPCGLIWYERGWGGQELFMSTFSSEHTLFTLLFRIEELLYVRVYWINLYFLKPREKIHRIMSKYLSIGTLKNNSPFECSEENMWKRKPF